MYVWCVCRLYEWVRDKKHRIGDSVSVLTICGRYRLSAAIFRYQSPFVSHMGSAPPQPTHPFSIPPALLALPGAPMPPFAPLP